LEVFPGGKLAFFEFIASELAVNGTRKTVHGAGGVMAQILQIYLDFSSLPSTREITLDEIRFFYRPLIDGLIERQKLKYGNK
jgi:hypothetical protein